MKPLAAAVVAVTLVLGASDSAADSAAVTTGQPELDKKETYRRDKLARQAKDAGKARKVRLARWHARLAKRIAKPPAKLVNIFNGWTHEYIAIERGRRYLRDLPSAEELNRFFRCRYTNQSTKMDPKLIRVLMSAANHFRSDRVTVVSGHRSHKYNLLLRKKGRQVARRSQHTLGTAVDFALRRVSTKRLHKWAVDQKLGGVGLYRSSGFIHMDTGRIRFWEGR